MKKYSHIIKILTLLSILVVVLFVAHFFFFKDLKAKNKNIGELDYYLSTDLEREKYAIDTQRLLQNLESDIQLVKNSFIASGGDIEFIETLESIARQNGLQISIDSLVLEGDTKNASTTSMLFRVKASASGSWAGVYKFINQLESLKYKIKINALSFSGASATQDVETGTPSQNTWRTDFDIRVLKYR